jgi:hypothetical protein
VGECFQIFNERRVENPFAEIAAPKIAITDTTEQRIFCKLFEVSQEVGRARLKVTDDAENQMIRTSGVE